MTSTIKVRSKGTALVPDMKQLFNGVKRFVGWSHDPTLGEDLMVLVEDGSRKKMRSGGWRRVEEAVELDVSDPELALEYRRHLAYGDLLPADEATAAFANHGGYALKIGGKPVKFDPAAGGDITPTEPDASANGPKKKAG